MQYAAQFWGLVHACGAETLISSEEIDELLSRHVECLASILENDKLVNLFDTELGKTLIDNPYYSAEMIIREYAPESRSQNVIYLPKCLSQGDFDSIMTGNLDDQRANPNCMEALFNWPSVAIKCRFSPSRTSKCAQSGPTMKLWMSYSDKAPDLSTAPGCRSTLNRLLARE